MYYMDEIESGNYEYEVIEYDYDESLVSTYYWLLYSILFCENKINRIILYRFINEKNRDYCAGYIHTVVNST